MKRTAAAVRLALIAAIVSASVLVATPASAETIDSVVYTISGSAVTVTGYLGAGGAIVIPDSVEINAIVYPVKEIGAFALSEKQLTSVSIPNSITTIGSGAFAGNGLNSVTIPNSVRSIGNSAFANNLLDSVIISSAVDYIANNVFGNNRLTSITIPNSVSLIDNNAFSGNRLTSVTIPASVSFIGVNAFGYNLLTSATIYNGQSIGNSAFAGNPQLTTVNLRGAAPTTINDGGSGAASLGTAVGLTVIYDPAQSSTFTPMAGNVWRGYATRPAAALAVGSSIAPTTVGAVTADGASQQRILATIVNEFGTAAPGELVTFAPVAGITLSASTCTTTSAGTCSVAATSTVAATYAVGASIAAGSLAPVSVVFGARPADVSTSTIISDSSTIIADGSDPATITIIARDALGNRLTGSAGTVTASSTLGTLSPVTDNGDGSYTATLIMATAGSARVSFTLAGASASASVIITALATPVALAATGANPLAASGIGALMLALGATLILRRRRTARLRPLR